MGRGCALENERTIRAVHWRGTGRTTFERQKKWMESAAFVDPFGTFRPRTDYSPVEEAEKYPATLISLARCARRVPAAFRRDARSRGRCDIRG